MNGINALLFVATKWTNSFYTKKESFYARSENNLSSKHLISFFLIIKTNRKDRVSFFPQANFPKVGLL